MTTFLVPPMAVFVNPFEPQGPDFLAFFAWTFIAALFASLLMRWLLRADHVVLREEELDPYELAVLTEGEQLAASASLAKLMRQGGLETSGTQVRVAGALPSTASPLDQAVHRAVERHQPVDAARVIKDVRPATAAIRAGLENRGLLETRNSFAAARCFTTLTMGSVLVMGLVKICIGISRDKPVLFLVAGCVVAFVSLWALGKRPHRTRAGDRIVESHRKKSAHLKSAEDIGSMTDTDLSLAMGLFGATMFLETEYAPVVTRSEKKVDTSRSTGGWFDGGGCGGGGCGGCGGCGG